MQVVISVFLALVLILMTSKIKINIKYLTKEKKSLKIDFNVNFELYIFRIIKILGISLKNDGIHVLFFKIPYHFMKFNKNTFKAFKDFPVIRVLKILNIKFEKIYLKLIIGLENSMTSAILTGLLSGFISSISGIKYKKINFKNFYYKIIPIYNTNLLEFDTSFKISIKFINIIKAYCFIKKKNQIKNQQMYSQKKISTVA